MANVIETTISINDNMSKAFQNVNKALNNVISSMESMSRSSSNAIDTRALTIARQYINQAETAFLDVDAAIDEVRESTKQTTNATGLFTKKVKDSNSAAQSLKSTVAKIGTTIATAFGAKQVINLADTFSQTKSRLDLMNDGMQTTAELQQKIYDSATNARGAYQTTADAVSKMGILAGDAFSSNDEIIAFMEQVNKQFTISGTSAAGTEAAMLQLTQAMGAGALRGEELNSILEQAPTIVQAIAKHMGVNVGQLREMASEGEVTSEVVKTALLAAADETNAKFNSMPKTFGQIWTDFKNKGLFAFQSTLTKLNEIANSPAFTTFVNNAAGAFAKLEPVITGAVQCLVDIATNQSVITFFDTIKTSIENVFNAFLDLVGVESPSQLFSEISGACTTLAENLTPIVKGIGDFVSKVVELAGTTGGKAVIAGLASAFGLLKIGMAGVKISEFIKNVKGLSEVGTFASGLKTLAASSKIATAAQWLFNTSLFGCPIIWIIAAIVALIAIIVLCVKYWDKIKAAALSCWEGIKSVWGSVCEWFNSLWDGIVAGAKSIWGSITSFFSNLWNGIVSGAKSIWGSITSFFSGLWNGIVSVTTSVWSSIVGFFSGIWNAIWNVISPVVMGIWNLISTIFTVIRDIIVAICQGIWATIQRVWNSIVTTISTVCTAIWTKIVTIWNSIIAFITPILEMIKNVISIAWNAIKTTATTIWNGIKTVVSTVWNAISSTVSGVVNSIKSKITTVWNSIKTTTSNIWNNIKTKISTALSSMITAVKTKVTEIYNKIKSKFDEILTTIGNLKDKFLQKGKDIMQGLIDGIAGKLKDLTAKVKEIGDTVVSNIKEFFNINSPSVVMRKLGEFVFAGFNNGLANMINTIRKTTVKMGEVVTNVVPVMADDITPMYTGKTPEQLKAMRESVSNRTTNTTTIKSPITITIHNDNTINNDVDISRFTRRLANGIAQQIGLELEGVY